MDDIPIYVNHKSERFIDQVRLFIRSRNLAYATEKTYVSWILRFIRFHNKRHPRDMGQCEIEAFLDYLVLQRYCSKSTQRTALNAIIFLYTKFLQHDDIGQLSFKSSKRHPRIPVVFTHEEAMSVINLLNGKYKLMVKLMYGSGLENLEFKRKPQATHSDTLLLHNCYKMGTIFAPFNNCSDIATYQPRKSIPTC